jgi:hypothetical protein
MARDAAPIDATNMPDVSRLVHEVNRTGRPRLLRANGETARLSPARPHRRPKAPSAADIAAALAVAGAWEGRLDFDQLKQDLAAAQWDDNRDRSL